MKRNHSAIARKAWQTRKKMKQAHEAVHRAMAPEIESLLRRCASSAETDPQLLQRLGCDAAKWAAEFRKTAINLGYSDMDEGWLISWFANAIETARQSERGG